MTPERLIVHRNRNHRQLRVRIALTLPLQAVQLNVDGRECPDLERDDSGRAGRGAVRHWVLQVARVTSIAIVCVGVASCVSDRYVRDWTYNGIDLSDTLVVFDNSFNLERVSARGTELFSGRFETEEERWRFEIETWKPPGGEERHFDPPLVFECRGRLFEKGIAFFSGRFIDAAPIDLFIRTPTDFEKN